MSDGGKGSARRPENYELLNANWDAIFGPRKRPAADSPVCAGPELLVPLGEWKEGTEVPKAANE